MSILYACLNSCLHFNDLCARFIAYLFLRCKTVVQFWSQAYKIVDQLQADLPGLDLVIERFIEPNIRLAVWMVEKNEVSGRKRIEPLADKISLGVFESGSRFHLIPDA